MKALLAVAVGFAFLAGGQDEAALKKEKQLLLGTWKIESFEAQDGKKEDFVGATMTFADDGKAEFMKGNDSKKATYSINPAGKPKEIDVKPEGKDDAMLGIYRIEKDALTICIVEGPNAIRPAEFTAKGQNALVTFKRVKK